MSRPKSPWKLLKMNDVGLDRITAVVDKRGLSGMNVTLRALRHDKVRENSSFQINLLLLTHAPCRRRKCSLGFMFAVLSSTL